MALVVVGEAFEDAVLVLPNALLQLRGEADVQGAASPRHDVDVEDVFAHQVHSLVHKVLKTMAGIETADLSTALRFG